MVQLTWNFATSSIKLLIEASILGKRFFSIEEQIDFVISASNSDLEIGWGSIDCFEAKNDSKIGFGKDEASRDGLD